MSILRSTICLLLSLSVLLHTWGQSDAIKALEDKLSDARTDSAKAWTCLLLHDAVFRTNLDKAREYAQSGLTYAAQAHNPLLQAKAYAGLARCERKRRYYPAVYPFDSLSLIQAQVSGSKDMVFAAQLMYSHDYMDDKKPATALTWLKKAEATALQTGKPELQTKIYLALAYYYAQTDHHKLAIPYFQKAIPAFEAAGNTYKAAESRIFLAQSLLAIGKTDSTAKLVFDAMEIYKKNDNKAGLASANEVLGNIFLTTGDADKGLYYYREAQRIFRELKNDAEWALTIPDMARVYLYKKDYSTVLSKIHEADSIFTALEYDPGKVRMYTLWGQYYSERRQPEMAESNFKKADSMLQVENLPDLNTENQKYWAQHKYRYRNFRAGDSLTYAYAQRIADSREPEVIARELNLIREKNRDLDTNSLKILALLYKPGGAKLLREQMKEKSLYQLLPMDSLQALNPFSMATGKYDSIQNASFGRQLLELEAQYRTQQIHDSLKISLQQEQITEQKMIKKNVLLVSIAVVSLVLCIGFILQSRSRRRAERDKASIELLQGQVHHSVKNNLAIVNRFVEIAERNGSENFSLSALKTRVAAMELLHKHLYQNNHFGIISLQDYLSELIQRINESFPTIVPVEFQLDASVMLESRIAEKIGLIINELVTNSLKYAFNDGRKGKIKIVLQEAKKGEYLLEVADNGPGFAGGERKKGYGTRLITGFSHELNGKIHYDHSDGARFIMSFQVMSTKK